ncbi:acetoin utilization protein AcuC [Bacillus spongiae]|uniref:Acetoin utilization protein AcuC n=1 Tax=Bacillus spongiae TaxID=2683610 RepID=A0ABU8HHI9_9BACI
MKNAVFVYSDELLSYCFSKEHPFNQFRLKLTVDLLKSMGAIGDQDIISPRMATDEELCSIHYSDFVNAVKLAGKGELSSETSENYGIGTEDTPIFPNMHEASAFLVGGTLKAVEEVMSGRAKHALHLGGGLHHGFRGKASGFCVYNDSSVAIKYMQEKYNARVLYVDTDAHHGDGVQWAFYDDPNVCTFSIHETGRYLFPGTGQVNERGSGKGYGYCFNIPLDAFTEDESWIQSYEEALTAVTAYFKPDVIITQNGADAHFYDPLTHLNSTIDIYKRIPQLAHQLAHQYCEGRWIAVGGGGYDIWRVVPRAWSLLWLEMSDQHLNTNKVPSDWIKQYQQQSPVPLPTHWTDAIDMYKPIPRKNEITDKNAQTVSKLLYPIKKYQTNQRSV